VPHIPQKRKSSGLAKLHTGQVTVKPVPHEPQKRIPGGLSKSQFGHFIALNYTLNRGIL